MKCIGQRVQITIEEPVMEVCEEINQATGVIVGKDDWLFPYTVMLDNPRLDRLVNEVTPRRFAEYELSIQ